MRGIEADKQQNLIRRLYNKNIEILETDKKIAKLKYQDKLLDLKWVCERGIILADFLGAIVNKEYVSRKTMKKLISKDLKLVTTFEVIDDKAYIKPDKFKQLHDEYVALEAALVKEEEYLNKK
ncbi:hypothetical protein [Cytobacillus gottheilii]|uniref:hypothetical protein n=1 Tax=Cytobacillus gottheilii TaxID=859144 RepID=UPI0009B9F1AF|nr:hypothetical protein [Cytobacillus gottheilii]